MSEKPAGNAGERSPHVLEIKGLDVTYSTSRGDVKAVRGLDLAVRRGEILGIAGESGSGKSTLAVALLRLLKPPGQVTAGSVLFHPAGRSPVDLLKVDGEELRVLRWSALSYLPQGSMSSLNPVMRVEDQFKDVILEHAPARKASLGELIPRLLGQVGWSRGWPGCSRTSCPAG